MMTSDETRVKHWQTVYSTKGDAEVSWYEASPDLSIGLLERTGLGTEAAVIDVGGGASRFVDELVARQQANVTVLDISGEALARARQRLGRRGAHVRWIESDVTTWQPSAPVDIWHDRAAFHFMTAPEDRAAYVETLGKALKPGGFAIIGTFALDGPERCSGLPVSRYSPETLAGALGDGFAPFHSEYYAHTTPWGSVQKFQFSILRRI